MRLQKGTLHLFQLFGVNVSVHWSWAVVAVIEVMYFSRGQGGSALALAAAVYLSLFAIVLMHEFGHALACKSVGGKAERIVLWPLGGVAFVQPPPRPGAVLWSIAAGPLVNVLLVPATVWFALAAGVRLDNLGNGGGLHQLPFIAQYALYVCLMNIALLVFNLAPIYPLDGGQILQSLLWFVVGRGRALIIAASIGIAGGVAIILGGLALGGLWLPILGVFALMQSWQGIKAGRMLRVIETAPRRIEPQPPTPVCPHCHEPPPVGGFWMCACGRTFDMFDAMGHCPHCGMLHDAARCPRCQAAARLVDWYSFVAGSAQPDRATVPPPLPAIMREPPVLPEDAPSRWKM
jgi:Zn-dependent protease